MKRLIAVPVAVAALVVPAAAAGTASLDASATHAVAAKGTQPFKITFDVYRQGNKPVGVDNFDVRRLKIDCDQGEFLLNFTLKVPGAFPDVVPVSDAGRFNAFGASSESQARIKGTFVTNQKVKGRVKVAGNFDGPDGNNLPDDLTNCEGSRRYTAK